MTDLAKVDSALLVVRGEVNESFAFDRMGRPRKADHNHHWHRMALSRLSSAAGDTAMPEPHTMLVGVPPRTPWPCWQRAGRMSLILRNGPRASACSRRSSSCPSPQWGRISARHALEELVSTQYE